MAMLPQLYTLSGIATEVRLDRRQVGNILANTPPDGKLEGKPAGMAARRRRSVRSRRPLGASLLREGGVERHAAKPASYAD